MTGMKMVGFRKTTVEIEYLKLSLLDKGKSELVHESVTFWSEPMEDAEIGELTEMFIGFQPPEVTSEIFCGFATIYALSKGQLKIFLTEEQFKEVREKYSIPLN